MSDESKDRGRPSAVIGGMGHSENLPVTPGSGGACSKHGVYVGGRCPKCPGWARRELAGLPKTVSVERYAAMHRRAQNAEAELAAKPTYAVLTETLEALKQAKSERHRYRLEAEYLRNRVRRLEDRLRERVPEPRSGEERTQKNVGRGTPQVTE